MSSLEFKIHDGTYAIVQLPVSSQWPALPSGSGILSVTKTEKEISIVCREELAPPSEKIDRDWKALELVGPFPFEMTGIISSFIRPLSENKIPVFVISTFDGDIVLVKNKTLAQTRELLRRDTNQ